MQAAVLSAVHVWSLQYGGIGVGRISLLCLDESWGLSVCWGVQKGFRELPSCEAFVIKIDLTLAIQCFCLWNFGPEMKGFFAAVIVPMQHYY